MKTSIYFSTLALITLPACVSGVKQKKQPEQPNIIFLLADDFGWMDLGCYGSKFYESPNIDQLAKDGMLFTDAYASCPVSSPTRYSLQTGKYPVRSGITDWIEGRFHNPRQRENMLEVCPVLPPDNEFNMSLDEVTIAEVLKSQGYQTAHVGKWHLAEDSTLFPQYQGYDINIGGCRKGSPGPGGYFVPYNNPMLEDGPEGEYLTNRLGDECVKIINQFKDKPFFINYNFYQVHTPLMGLTEKIDYFKEKAVRMGLDTIAKIFDENPSWKSKQPFTSNSYRERLVQSNPVYAAMISSMDDNVGKVIQELKRLGLYENTIIFFTSDNGGLSTSEGSPTSNLPLRAGKGHLYEGGIREPLIAVWKKQIKSGTVSHTQVSTIDFFPTLLDLIGCPIPTQPEIDGISIKPALMGKKQKRGTLYWHYPHYPNQGSRPGGAILEGDYKLIEFFDNGEKELYNIREDIGEQHNLMDTNKQTADRLAKKLVRWREEVHAKMPVPNPGYHPVQK